MANVGSVFGKEDVLLSLDGRYLCQMKNSHVENSVYMLHCGK